MNNDIQLDLACAIFRNIQAKNQYLNRHANKGNFLIQCLLEFTHIKKFDYLIIKNHLTTMLEIEEIKFYFWHVEIPELQQEDEYIEYLYKELISAFYSSEI